MRVLCMCAVCLCLFVCARKRLCKQKEDLICVILCISFYPLLAYMHRTLFSCSVATPAPAGAACLLDGVDAKVSLRFSSTF